MPALSRTLCLGLLLVLAAASGTRAAEEQHAVVLADGTTTWSRTRPVIAFGQVRYTTADSRVQVLQAAAVDVAATRAHPSNQAAAAAGGLSFVGGGPAPSGMPKGAGTPSVTIYSATWCGQCTRTKQWLSARGVAYRSIEVDRLEGAAKQQAEATMRERAGRVAFPVVLIGTQAVLGFAPDEFSRLLGTAALKTGPPKAP
jgi:glutaredoxin